MAVAGNDPSPGAISTARKLLGSSLRMRSVRWLENLHAHASHLERRQRWSEVQANARLPGGRELVVQRRGIPVSAVLSDLGLYLSAFWRKLGAPGGLRVDEPCVG
jgi:hypothetical protein